MQRILLGIIIGAVLTAVIFLFVPRKGTETNNNQLPPVTQNSPLVTEKVIVNTPLPGSTISSPLEITGQARGVWFFEASFPVILLDGNGKQIAITPAEAQGEWMTTEFVPFKTTLVFPKPTTTTGTLIFRKDNPSDMRELDEQVEMPVRFSP